MVANTKDSIRPSNVAPKTQNGQDKRQASNDGGFSDTTKDENHRDNDNPQHNNTSKAKKTTASVWEYSGDDLEYTGTYWPSGHRKPPYPPDQGKSAHEQPEWLKTLNGDSSRKRKASGEDSKTEKASRKRCKSIYDDAGIRIGTLFGQGNTVYATLDRRDRVQFYTKSRGKRIVRAKVDFNAVDLDPKFENAEEATIEAIVKAQFEDD